MSAHWIFCAPDGIEFSPGDRQFVFFSGFAENGRPVPWGWAMMALAQGSQPRRFVWRPLTHCFMPRIAIVGAGPSGASAGVHLARMGHQVVLFDRTAFPRDKPCGDWLTPLALREVEALGIDVQALREQAGASAGVHSTALRAPSGRTSRVALSSQSGGPSPGKGPFEVATRNAADANGRGLCIPRRHLDALLVAQAMAAGCQWRRQAFATVATQTPGLEDCDLVVDARGSSAGPVCAVGLRGYWTLARSAFEACSRQHQDFARCEHEVSIRTSDDRRRGYGWVFPVDVRDDRITLNVGVGLWKADIRAGEGPRDMLERFVSADPLARWVDRHAVERSRPQGFPLAMGGWSTQRVGRGRWARIGDAAALADPLTGDGIGNALLSGRLLAEAVGMADAGLCPLEGASITPSPGRPASPWAPGDAWQARFEAELQPELRRAWLLRQLLVPNLAKNAAAWLMDQSPQALRRRLHAALFGVRTYRDALF